MERRTEKCSIAFAKGKIKRVLAILLAILVVITGINYNGIKYISAADEEMVNIIKEFSPLSESVANQDLKVGAEETAAWKPGYLTVSSEVYWIDTTQVASGSAIVVSGSAISANPSDTLDITWELDETQSSYPAFDSSIANTYYTYKAVLPATDRQGNAVQLADGVSLPQIRVRITYGVSIGGVPVDSNDWYAITDASGTVTTEGASADQFNVHVVLGDVGGTPTATVTLNNATIANTSNRNAIKVEGWDLNIVLEGTANQIGVGITNGHGDAINSSTENKVTIAGEGDLTLKGFYGLRVNGLEDVNINTTGNLNIASAWQIIQTSGALTVAANSIEAVGYYFNIGSLSLTATEGDIHITGSGTYGIQAYGDVIASAPKGTISVEGGEYAIKATEYLVNVAAKNNVTLTGTVSAKEISILSDTGNMNIDGYFTAIEGAQTSVTLSAPSGDMLLNAQRNNIISGWNNFTLAITAGGKLEAKGPYGITGYGNATIKADKVSVTNTTTGYGFNGGALTITNPNGGNCSEVYVSGGHNGMDVINAYQDVNIKADKVRILAGTSAKHAIYGNSIIGDVTVTIGESGLIVGAISIKGMNAISTGMLQAEKNGINASYGLNLNRNTPSQSTYYKAGDGYVIYEPSNGDTPASLLLHNATIHNGTTRIDNAIGTENEGIALPTGNIIIKVEGTNSIRSDYGDGIGYFGSHITLAGSGVLTVDGAAGDIFLDDGSFAFAEGADVTLNGVVSVINDYIPQNTDTVYGNMTVSTYFRSLYGDAIIANGTTVTIPEGQMLWMDETDSITINGQIVNNGTIVLPYNYTTQQIQALNLHGEILLRDAEGNKYRIYRNGAIYAYGGRVDYNFSMADAPTEVTYYETIDGYFLFIPASGSTQAKLTLHNVDLYGDFTLPDIPLMFDLEGNNTIECIKASASTVMEGSGKLTVDYFENSNAGASLIVNSAAMFNTMYSSTIDDIETNTIYGSYSLSEDSRFYVGPSKKLVLSSGAVLTLRYDGNLEFHSGTALTDMTLGVGASIVNNTHITLPQGTTPEQIMALPLSGTGVVRVTTAYDSHGYPDAWDTYTNDGLPITEVEGEYLELTATEVLVSENKGYTWIKSGETDNEIWTLTLNNTYIGGSLYLPRKAVVINTTADSIISGNIVSSNEDELNITFTGTAPLALGGSISGGRSGDTVTVQAGAKVSVDESIFLGGYGGTDGTLKINGKGTTLNVSALMGCAVTCDSVSILDGATMTVKALGEDSIGVQAISNVSIKGGSTLTARGDYGIYITGEQRNGVDVVGKLTMDESSKLITNGSVAPFCIVDRTSTKGKSDVLTLAGIPSGTVIASVRGTDTGYGYTYWSLVPVGRSLNVTNESNAPVTLTGAVSEQLSFIKAVIHEETPGGSTGGNTGGNSGGTPDGNSGDTPSGNSDDKSGQTPNDSSSLVTIKPDTKIPVIKVGSNKEDWEELNKQIRQSKDGDTVKVEMNGSSIIPKEVLGTIKGKDTILVFDIGDGITWKVNGKSVTEDSLENINLAITLDTDAIPENLINEIAGEQAYRSISLSHDGNFGFDAVLSINLEKKNAGQYANLFYLNPTTGKLELQSMGIIDEEGYVEYKFTHASDYVVVLSTEPLYAKAIDQIAINTTKKTLYVDGTKNKSLNLKLELPELLEELTEKDSSRFVITYQSSNPKVATVNSAGKIVAKKSGKATITTLVTIDGVQKSFTTAIQVSKAYIKLTKSTKALKKGEAFTFQAKGYGVNSEDMMYYTSKKSILVIDKKTGKAIAKSAGTDYIIVRAGKVKVTMKVKVK